MSTQLETGLGQKTLPPGCGSAGSIEMLPICVTIKNACALLSIGRSTFFKLEKEKRIVVLRLGSKVLVPMTSIHQFVASLPSSRRHASKISSAP
jgi:excisionase family DNA binding protein